VGSCHVRDGFQVVSIGKFHIGGVVMFKVGDKVRKKGDGWVFEVVGIRGSRMQTWVVLNDDKEYWQNPKNLELAFEPLENTPSPIKHQPKQLAEDHWSYIEALLKVHGDKDIEVIGFHCRTAFEHGYKHAMEDLG